MLSQIYLVLFGLILISCMALRVDTSTDNQPWAAKGPYWAIWQEIAQCRAYCAQQLITWPTADKQMQSSSAGRKCWNNCEWITSLPSNQECNNVEADPKSHNKGSVIFCEFSRKRKPPDSTIAASTRPQVFIHDKHTLRVDWTSPTTSTEEAIVYNVFWTDYQHDDGWEHLEMLLNQGLKIEDEGVPLSQFKGLRFRVVAITAQAILSDDVVIAHFPEEEENPGPEKMTMSSGSDGDFLVPVNSVMRNGLHANNSEHVLDEYADPDYFSHEYVDDDIPDVEDSLHVDHGFSVQTLNSKIVQKLMDSGTLSVRLQWENLGWHDEPYVILWARTSCDLNERYPSCGLAHDHYRSGALDSATTDNVFLPDITFNSHYTVTIETTSGDILDKVDFNTRGCWHPDSDFVRCLSNTTDSLYNVNVSCVHASTTHGELSVQFKWTPVQHKASFKVVYLFHMWSEDHGNTPWQTEDNGILAKMKTDNIYAVQVKAILTKQETNKRRDIMYPIVKVNSSSLHSTARCANTLPQTRASVEGHDARIFPVIITLSAFAVVSIIGVIFFIVYKKCNRIRDVIITKGSVAKSNSYKSSLGAGYHHCVKEEALLVIHDEWELDPRDVQLGRELGEGAFGRVMTGFYRDYKVAIKLLKEDVEDFYRDDLLREINLMKKIGKHPNIVSMIGACTVREPLALIMEYMPFGNLQNFLRRCRLEGELKRTDDSRCELVYSQLNELGSLEEWSVTSTDVLAFARQVVLAMEYLSQRQYIHRDLAARNILLGPGKVVKVCDFGLARVVYNGDQYYKLTNGRLPMKWMAVESLKDRVFTTSSDVWAFGILLWEIVTMGATPYPNVALTNLYTYLAEGNRMSQPANCSNEIYSMMLMCWCENPSDRPTFSNLREHLEQLLTRNRDYLDLSNFERLHLQQAESGDGGVGGSESPEVDADRDSVMDTLLPESDNDEYSSHSSSLVSSVLCPLTSGQFVETEILPEAEEDETNALAISCV